uniref:Transcriptional regulator n=1 Tax=viral metagenome TaxID=1070528 RepID=A0A6M3X496_9ZZZZ
MKVKSVSDLAFKALDKLTEGEDELWVAHIVFDGQARRTGGIQKIMKKDCGVPHYSVQRTLNRLVSKNIVYRVIQGIYAPNLTLVLDKMIEILEEEQEGENAAG